MARGKSTCLALRAAEGVGSLDTWCHVQMCESSPCLPSGESWSNDLWGRVLSALFVQQLVHIGTFDSSSIHLSCVNPEGTLVVPPGCCMRQTGRVHSLSRTWCSDCTCQPRVLEHKQLQAMLTHRCSHPSDFLSRSQRETAGGYLHLSTALVPGCT